MIPNTYGEWQSAIVEASRAKQAGALTTMEWREHLKYGKPRTIKWIKEGLARKWLVATHKNYVRIDGVLTRLPAYALTRKTKG